MDMDIYDRIQTILSEKSMSRKQLSRQSGIPYATLNSMFFRKSTNISIEHIKQLALCLNVSLDTLILGEDAFLISENQVPEYIPQDLEMQRAVNEIFPRLSIKNKTRLLSHAYELEASEKR